MTFKAGISYSFLCVFLFATIGFQADYAERRYGKRVTVPECPWCDARDARVDDVVFLPIDSSFLRLCAPADPDFIADLLWLRVCYYFGQHAITNRQYPYLFHLLENLTNLSPYWVEPYLFAALILPTEADNMEDGLYLIEKGIAFHPDNWQLWFFRGYYYWKYLEDETRAAEYLYTAGRLPDAPSYLIPLASRLATEGGRNELAVRFINEALEHLDDEQQRKILLKKLEEISKK